jgi:hypothetical protein
MGRNGGGATETGVADLGEYGKTVNMIDIVFFFATIESSSASRVVDPNHVNRQCEFIPNDIRHVGYMSQIVIISC